MSAEREFNRPGDTMNDFLAGSQAEVLPPGTFTEVEYNADPNRVYAHAFETGRAIVVRSDGSVRVAISIPQDDIRECDFEDEHVRAPDAFDILAANLVVAAAACEAFERGRDYQFGIDEAVGRHEERMARREGWHPGCGRATP